MPKRWCHNSKTGEIFSYIEAEGITDFPRGTWLAYGDYLTVGFKDEEEAKAWAKEWGPCHKCRKVSKKPICVFCGNRVD